MNVWSRGGLTWKQIASELWTRSQAHRLPDRAASLSFYFVVAFLPLLIVLTTIIGFILASQSDVYLILLKYFASIMPRSAFAILQQTLEQITGGANGQQLSFGLAVSFWSASSGMAALIEALNTAFDVPRPRSWWRRRLVAMGLTLSIVLLVTAALLFLLAGTTVTAILTSRLPFLALLSHLSTAAGALVELVMLFCWMMLVYALGPNLKRNRWEGVLPGTCLALFSWLTASFFLRLYLAGFASLNHSYGSIAGAIALLFWLYLSATAVLLGGELNSIIWHATEEKTSADA